MKVQSLYPGIRQNAKLSPKDAKIILKDLRELYSTVDERKKGVAFSHNRIQRIVATFFQLKNYDVNLEVPFSSGGFYSKKVRFDIAAEKGNRVIVVEVKDILDKRDFGQVEFYKKILELNNVNAKLYLALDILSLDSFLEPAFAEVMNNLMVQEDIGLIFVDKNLLIAFDNTEQFNLERMPLMIYTDEDIM